jgi:hypothetical protein
MLDKENYFFRAKKINFCFTVKKTVAKTEIGRRKGVSNLINLTISLAKVETVPI